MHLKLLLLIPLLLLYTQSDTQSRRRSKKNKKPKPILLLSTGPQFNFSKDKTKVFFDDAKEFGLEFQESPRLSFSAQFQKIKPNNRFWSIGVSELHWFRKSNVSTLERSQTINTQGGEDFRMFSFHTRFNYGKLFGDFQKQRICLALSAGLEGFVNYREMIPATSAYFPIEVLKYGFDLKVVPELFIRLSNQLHLLIGTAPTIATSHLESISVQNPILTKRQRTADEFDTGIGFNDLSLHFQIVFVL